MKIGVPKEIKDLEYRVALTPISVRECIIQGHQVFIESGAGNGVGASDADYIAAGASITADAAATYANSELIVKVKEPQTVERQQYLTADKIIFSYLHLAPDRAQTDDLLASKTTAIAFETVVAPDRRTLPLLTPMSRIAGRLAPSVAARLLEKSEGGKGLLFGRVPGVAAAKVIIIGGGVVGENAIDVSLGMGAEVTVFDRDITRLAELSARFGNALITRYATEQDLHAAVTTADVVIGAVHVRGKRARHVVSEAMIKAMPQHSVFVDVCIDQGGCSETSRVTSHSNPTYVEHGIIHYCVANMPGIVPVSSSHALNHAILPYVLAIAAKGAQQALRDDPGLLQGLNTYRGQLTNAAVAEAQQRDWISSEQALTSK